MAPSFKDISEFRELLVKPISIAYPDLEVTLDLHDSAVIHISHPDGMTTRNDLTNLFGYINAYPDEEEESILRFVRGFSDHEEMMSGSVNLDSIYVVLREQGYISMCRDQDEMIINFPYSGDLHGLFIIDMPDTIGVLGRAEIGECSDQALLKIALKNLEPWLSKVVFSSLEGAGLYYVEGNTFLTTSLVFLESFWSIVEQQFGTDYFVALPRKDQLFVFDRKDPLALKYARRMVEITFEENFNLLTNCVFERRNGRLHVVE